MSGNIPGMITKTLLCVDNVSGADISGRFYNLYLEKPVLFETLHEFLDKMEEFFDAISFPQNFFDFRCFREEGKEPARNVRTEWKKYWSDVLFDVEKGEQATFIFQVQYRQSAEWQGSLTWVEQKKQFAFRSALDFIRLLDAVLYGEEEGAVIGWSESAADAG
ncbi:MAG: hypothetical protein LBQ16_02625 [Gracilibacteraceae bacterium]|jgi:hypothetical protein|nr:hypothetical protein [Gracilibacteraceae bacterium]